MTSKMTFNRKVFDRAPILVWIRWMRAEKIKISDVDFHGADFRCVDFHGVDFHGAVFRWVNFRGADFLCVDFHGADFNGANFRCVDFYGADFSGADFRWVNFSGANFNGADFRWAKFHGADFRCVDFSGANFNGANFSCSKFHGADFYDSSFRGADFSDVDFNGADFYGTALCMQCPSEGSFIGWKKVNGALIKLQITPNAKRSSATTHKCRCSEALVLEIDGGAMQQITRNSYAPITYKVGELVHPDSFDDDRWNECSHGIHFFISRHNAEEY